jgi:hypothetical protein
MSVRIYLPLGTPDAKPLHGGVRGAPFSPWDYCMQVGLIYVP